MKSGKNSAASIRQRLLNLARAQKQEFQLVLTRFALERFLYRLSQSEYRNDFVLKGAMLFQMWGGAARRLTRDLDLLSFGDADPARYAAVFENICKLEVPADGLVFHADSIRLERIKAHDEYHGLRATMLVTLESARISLQIDIGFGDAVEPAPVMIDFPTALDLPMPRLRAYSRENVVAEKFHAMVVLGIANTRMKDFYDLWTLASTYEFDSLLLRAAIEATFKGRETPIPVDPPLALTDKFAEEPVKMAQWNAFLNKGKLATAQPIALREVVQTISGMLMPLLREPKGEGAGQRRWSPEGGVWGVEE